MKFEDYEKVVTQTRSLEILQYNLQSKNHIVKLVKERKTAFSTLEDKRFYTCSLHSVPFNSILCKFYRINSACPFCEYPKQLFDTYDPLEGQKLKEKKDESDLEMEVGSELDDLFREHFDYGGSCLMSIDMNMIDEEGNLKVDV